MIYKVAVDADVKNGDELRIDGGRYLVEGVGTFTNARLAALSEIKGGA
jgi:sorbitol-specific phosphotransferase system component IIA